MTRGEQGKALDNRRRELIDEIGRLQDELKQREAQLPAHSVRPHQIMALEALEETIKGKQVELHNIERELVQSEIFEGNPLRR
jgi:hypothetical protein